MQFPLLNVAFVMLKCFVRLFFSLLKITGVTYLNPFAPGDFAEKRVLTLVEWFSGHCRAIKT